MVDFEKVFTRLLTVALFYLIYISATIMYVKIKNFAKGCINLLK